MNSCQASENPAAANRPGPIPASVGVGLKPQHFHEILEKRPTIGWFEVHPENYMGAGGSPHLYLTAIRRDYPLSLHGVGLSLGSAGPLDRDHVLRLKELADRYEPGLISEHLAWTRHGQTHFNDLLPMPMTQEALDVMSAHVDEVQNILGRRILIENPSVYLDIACAELSEPEFLRALAQRTGCGLLVDINNVYVSAANCGTDAATWLNEIPAECVEEVHLAGHATEVVDGERLLIDDHGSPVTYEVLNLYRRFIERVGARPTLIEWDTDVPPLDVLLNEAGRARIQLDRATNLNVLMGQSHV